MTELFNVIRLFNGIKCLPGGVSHCLAKSTPPPLTSCLPLVPSWPVSWEGWPLRLRLCVHAVLGHLLFLSGVVAHALLLPALRLDLGLGDAAAPGDVLVLGGAAEHALLLPALGLNLCLDDVTAFGLNLALGDGAAAHSLFLPALGINFALGDIADPGLGLVLGDVAAPVQILALVGAASHTWLLPALGLNLGLDDITAAGLPHMPCSFTSPPPLS